MHGKAHFLIGASLGVALAGGISIEQLPVVAATATSALLPDLDTAHSDASRLLNLASGLGALTAAGYVMTHVSLGPFLHEPVGMAMFQTIEAWLPGTAPLLIVLGMAGISGIGTFLVASFVLSFAHPSRYLEHRGPLHWPLVGLMLAIIAVVLSELRLGQPMLGIAVAVGWFSHLVADLPTRGGMPLLKPIAEAPAHIHWRKIEQGWQRPLTATRRWCPLCRRVDCFRHEPYSCSNFHLTPPWLRWRSGDRKIELSIGIGGLATSLLATSASTWVPVVAVLVGRA